jgi:thiol:disulfide interchange protein
MDTTDGGVRSGPQSKIPPILFWLVAAAIVLRILTVALDRGKKDEGPGLVRWRPRASAATAARSEGKPLLYDFTAAWCPPCHRLDTEGWGDSGTASLVNASYTPVRVVDRAREDGKNPAPIDELQRRYSVRALPTLVVADPDGREIAKFEGYNGKEPLLRFLEESRKKPPR